MIAALPASSSASDDVRSYDLVWILHLVGDAHKPLHAAARYTLQIPHGDAGGNAESVMSASGSSIGSARLPARCIRRLFVALRRHLRRRR
ncbi:S1/P1 nuclease [Bradyrhizobium sp. ma5]|uniref:S1/P1 nuclease n=1 Tax=Bradyrhizobium sp. ma5 TaxID=3344828 RepID=UPI0035D402F0